MKKALQKTLFAGLRSVSETPVGRGAGEARPGGSRDEVPQLRILDGGGPFGRLARLLHGSRGWAFSRRVRCLGRRPGERSRHELDAVRYELSDSPGDLTGLLAELERPDFVEGVDDEDAVACEAGGPRVASDPVANRIRPGAEQLRHAGGRAEPAELASDLSIEALHQPGLTSPAATSSSCAGSTGRNDASVAVTSVWPRVATRSARIRRRAGSSSERTSSSR